MTLSEDQESSSNSNRVEIADLSLPSTCASTRDSSSGGLLVSGEGRQVVLEALPETVENILENRGSTCCTNNNTVITAVVDLKRLGDLAPEGVSRTRDLITDFLYHDSHNIPRNEEKTSAMDEESPLLCGSSSDRDRVALSADPFLESLADALIEKRGEAELPVEREDTILAEATAATTTTLGTDSHSSNQHDLHLAHDAFLLNIPNREEETDDRLVLALPSFRQVANNDNDGLSYDASIGELSVEDVPENAETATFMDVIKDYHQTATTALELPTDVVDVHLEAHQRYDEHETTPLEEKQAIMW